MNSRKSKPIKVKGNQVVPFQLATTTGFSSKSSVLIPTIFAISGNIDLNYMYYRFTRIHATLMPLSGTEAEANYGLVVLAYFDEDFQTSVTGTGISALSASVFNRNVSMTSSQVTPTTLKLSRSDLLSAPFKWWRCRPSATDPIQIQGTFVCAEDATATGNNHYVKFDYEIEFLENTVYGLALSSDANLKNLKTISEEDDFVVPEIKSLSLSSSHTSRPKNK
jgi:hypothetical protein